MAVPIAFEFLLCVLAADFVSGFIHWLEDAYGREDFPITGRWITRPNTLHHQNPRWFTRNNWWRSSWDLLCVSLLIVLAAWLCGKLTWHVWVFAVLGANANQIHKWAHRTPQENGWFINFLHRCRILQTPHHHALHHTDPKNSHYCVLTNLLNPVLDRLRFWETLENIILRFFGVARRVDISVARPPDALTRIAETERDAGSSFLKGRAALSTTRRAARRNPKPVVGKPRRLRAAAQT